jgi:hypothetical protein
MRLWMEFTPHVAVLHIVDGSEHTEVRGHPAVGSKYEGSRLDRVLNGIREANFNLSVLYAEDILHIRSGCGEPIRKLLRIEEEYVRRISNSTYITT